MNRIFFIVAAASAVVLSFAVSFAAESGNASTQKTDKDLYRTQHKGGFVMPKPIIAPQESVDVDKTPLPAQTVSPAQAVSQNVYYGKNRQVPAPPVVPFRTEQPVVVLQDAPMLSPMNRSGVVVLDRKAGEMPLEQRFAEETVLQPLSGIDLPKNTDTPASFTSPTFAPEVKKIDGVSPAPPAITPVPPTVAIPAAVITPHSNLDELNSRLAKIQLEKKNLPAVLSLVDKIKSPEFKVKTLVDLAEYVSRDSNYKKEADALYELAVAGIDALSEGKPVVVKVPETTAPIQAPKKQITLTDTPQEKPIEVKPVEIKPAMEPVETKPLTQLEVKPEGGKKLTIVDIDEEDKKPLPKPAPKLEDKPAEVKSVETKPTEPKPEDGKKLRIKIVDEEDEEPLPKPAPKLEDKPVETDMPKTTLPDTKEEPKSANVKPDSVKPEAEEVTPAESESATPTRKPMPRRKIVVTD